MRLISSMAERFVLDQPTLVARPRATEMQKDNVLAWVHNTKYTAIDPAELTFIRGRGDLMPIAHVMKGPLRRLADRKIDTDWWLV